MPYGNLRMYQRYVVARQGKSGAAQAKPGTVVGHLSPPAGYKEKYGSPSCGTGTNGRHPPEDAGKGEIGQGGLF